MRFRVRYMLTRKHKKTRIETIYGDMEVDLDADPARDDAARSRLRELVRAEVPTGYSLGGYVSEEIKI